MKYLSKIEDFYLGKFQEKELQEFINELENNPDLKSEFEIYKKALDFSISNERQINTDVSRLRDFEFNSVHLLDVKKYGGKRPINEEEKQLINILQIEHKDYISEKTTKHLYQKWIKIAALVTIVLSLGLAGIIVCHKKYDGNDLFQQFYSPYSHTTNSRSVSYSAEKSMLECLAFYDKKDFQNTIKVFSTIPVNILENSELAIVGGVSYIELRNYVEALRILDLINDKSLLYTTSLWYKGLCYLKLNDKKNAKEVFQRLNSFEPYYKNQTRKLLKAL